jgi:hypothetical protein
MKRSALFLMVTVVSLVLVGSPLFAAEGTIEGTVQGFTCVTSGKVCPVGKEDPMIAAERVFVVLEKGGKDYYFVPNLDRAILARHINQMVRVTGNMNPKYRSINANKLEVKEGGSWKTVWSTEMERQLLDKMEKESWG